MSATGGGSASAAAVADASSSEQPRPRQDSSRGRGRGRGNRGRGRGDAHARGGGAQRGRGRGHGGPDAADLVPQPQIQGTKGASIVPPEAAKKTIDEAATPEEEEGDLCFICANPINHRSIAPCNHITCHICALRMRALYKTKDCPHCRTAAPFVIFTDDATKRFDDYTEADTTSTDDNIGIRYTNEDIVGDTVLLLRYNCPDSSCDFAGMGWPDLHRHVRSVHHKKMCDLCTRNKKVFTHEHELFTDKGLEKHMRHGDDRPGALDQTGFRGHPLCAFCGERFYDDDKLYEHCRNKHERCFICDRRDSRQPHYYQNYDRLEEHFKKDHHLCLDRECLEKKFVVFESEMDLKAHQLSEHGGNLSKDVRRDARVVDMAGFDFRQTYEQERRAGRGRGRDPNTEPPPLTSAHAMRRDEIAFQRQLAIHSAQSVSNRTFGSQLTSPSPSAATRPAGAAPSSSSAQSSQPPIDPLATVSPEVAANLPPQERARLVRHGAVIERASNLLGNDATKIATFRSHISSFRSGQLSAAQLIDAFFALFAETSSTALGTLVRELADLFDDKSKAEALRKAWHDWRAINEDYPSLPGLGGMHGATTSTSGWAAAAAASPTTHPAANAQKHTTRVLKLKNSTRRGSGAGIPSPVAAPVARSVPGMARAAPPPRSATPSSTAFPALPGASSKPAQSSWIAPPSASSQPSKPPAPRRPAASSSEDAFPALPAAPKPMTTIFGYGTGAVRRDLGGSRDTGFSWGGNATASGSAGAATPEADSSDAAGGAKGKKKGKKQVLVQWG